MSKSGNSQGGRGCHGKPPALSMDALFTQEQLAVRLGILVGEVPLWIEKGLPVLTVSPDGDRRFHWRAVDAWLRTHSRSIGRST